MILSSSFISILLYYSGIVNVYFFFFFFAGCGTDGDTTSYFEAATAGAVPTGTSPIDANDGGKGSAVRFTPVYSCHLLLSLINT